MGIWLLAIESVILSLLWVATGMAWKERKPSYWGGFVVANMFLLPLVVYGALVAAYLAITSRAQLNPQFPFVLALLVGGYLLGTVVMWGKARRPLPAEHGLGLSTGGIAERQASRWPAGKLAVATLLAFVLHTLTFWNLDAAMQQRLEALRVEASAKALAQAPGRPPDRENAAIVYEQAFALLPEHNEWPEGFIDWIDPKYLAQHPAVLKDPELRAFLKSHSQMIDLLHQAAALPACSFDRNYAEPRIDMLIPEVTSMRDAARIVMLQARVDADQGDLRAAVEKIQTICMMGEHVAADPLLVSLLVSFALDNMATETLQAVLSGQHPSAEELAPLDFGPPHATSRRMARALRMEEAFGLATFGQMATQTNMWAFLDGVQTNPDLAWIFPASLALYRVLLLEDDVEAYRALLGKHHELAKLSPTAARDKVAEVDRELAFHPSGLLTSLLVPALKLCILASGRHAAKMETAQTGVAVHRYRAEHDKLPKQLSDLVPDYLPAVPLDPYDDQPLRWKVTGDDWVVYSVGEDLKDDGGAVFNSLDYTGDIGFYAVRPALPVEPAAKENPVEQPQPEQPVEDFKIPAEPAPDLNEALLEKAAEK